MITHISLSNLVPEICFVAGVITEVEFVPVSSSFRAGGVNSGAEADSGGFFSFERAAAGSDSF